MGELVLNPIIPFDLIVDIDVGLIKMIDKRYHNTDTFYSSLLSAPIKNLTYLLYNREDRNPLSIVMKEKNKDLMDDYYKQFMEQEYQNILENSSITNMYHFISLCTTSDGNVNPTILCSNEMERNYLLELDRELFSKYRIIIGKLEWISLSGFDPIYVKYYEDAIKSVKEMYGKNLYIAGYRFNLVEYEGKYIVNPKVNLVLGNANKIVRTAIYNFDESDKGKG